LSNAARKVLRGLAHPLQPVVWIGKDGVTDGVIASVREALIDHELIKVRIQTNAELDKHDAANETAFRARAALVQLIGKTIILYAPHATDPRIELPD
jgi:RNA-binding protein